MEVSTGLFLAVFFSLQGANIVEAKSTQLNIDNDFNRQSPSVHEHRPTSISQGPPLKRHHVRYSDSDSASYRVAVDVVSESLEHRRNCSKEFFVLYHGSNPLNVTCGLLCEKRDACVFLASYRKARLGLTTRSNVTKITFFVTFFRCSNKSSCLFRGDHSGKKPGAVSSAIESGPRREPREQGRLLLQRLRERRSPALSEVIFSSSPNHPGAIYSLLFVAVLGGILALAVVLNIFFCCRPPCCEKCLKGESCLEGNHEEEEEEEEEE